MLNIPKTLEDFIAQAGSIKRVFVAYSGGVDSTVLLHALSCADVDLPVTAVHINHQLSKFAGQWQSHCASIAKAQNVDFITECVVVENKGKGVEDEARRQRYSAMEQHIGEGDLLLCAHHAGDQLETFFLRLLRGAGIHGLAGIKALRPFGLGALGRPLLGISKASLLEYAQKFELQWVEDDSNKSDVFDRNFVRKHITPTLISRWPETERKVGVTTGHLAEASSLLDEYAKEDYQHLDPRSERFGKSILLPIQLSWSAPRVVHVLRYWLSQCGVKPPTVKQCDELVRVINAKADQQPVLQLGEVEVRRYKTRLYCLPVATFTKGESEVTLRFDEGQALLPDGSILRMQGLRAGIEAKTFRIKFRQPGLRCHPSDRAHSQTLKKLLQEYQLEPWLRSRVPLVYDGETLVAVGDLWVERAANLGLRTTDSKQSKLQVPEISFKWLFPPK